MKIFALLSSLAVSLVLAQPPLAPPPSDAGALLKSAILAEKAGDIPNAMREFENVLRSDPPVEVAGQARLELLRIHERRGDSWKAAEQLRELRKLAPTDPEYAYQLGTVYQNLSRWAFNRMQQRAPQGARTQQILGEQYMIAEEREKAIGAFHKAIAADPKVAGSHLALAMIYMQLGKRTDALAEIERELAIAPQSAVATQLRKAITGARR